MTAPAASTEPAWFPLDCGIHECRKPVPRCWRCERAAHELADELRKRRVGNQRDGYRLEDDEKAKPITRATPARTQEKVMPKGQKRSSEKIAAIVADVVEHGMSPAEAAAKHGAERAAVNYYLRAAGHGVGTARSPATRGTGIQHAGIVSTVAQPEVREIRLTQEVIAELLARHIPAGSDVVLAGLDEDGREYETNAVIVRYSKPVAA